MSRRWWLTFKGGAYDGRRYLVDDEGAALPPVVIVFDCLPGFCRGHIALPDADYRLDTAVAYTKDEVDEVASTAVYVLGDPTGDGREADVEELVGAGAGLAGFDRAGVERHRTGWPA